MGSVNIWFVIFPIRLGRRHHPPTKKHRPSNIRAFGKEKMKKENELINREKKSICILNIFNQKASISLQWIFRTIFQTAAKSVSNRG